MGGRFGKYGDAKRKAQIRNNRVRLPVPQQRTRDKPIKGSRKSKLLRGVQSCSYLIRSKSEGYTHEY